MIIPKQTITALGSVVAVLSILGLPGSFKTPLFFILGVLIAYISYQEHHHPRRHVVKRSARKVRGAVSIPIASEIASEERIVESEISKEPHDEIPS